MFSHQVERNTSGDKYVKVSSSFASREILNAKVDGFSNQTDVRSLVIELKITMLLSNNEFP